MRNPKTQSTMRPAALLLFLTMCFISVRACRASDERLNTAAVHCRGYDKLCHPYVQGHCQTQTGN